MEGIEDDIGRYRMEWYGEIEGGVVWQYGWWSGMRR